MKPKVKWNEAGLVPAVVQDAMSGRILMLAWMNAEALTRTIESGAGSFLVEEPPDPLEEGRDFGQRTPSPLPDRRL